MTTKKRSKPTEVWPVVCETYRRPDQWSLSQLVVRVPTCFNGIVSVRRWRVTVEPIDEPIEVLTARLQKLWEESDNIHHAQPLVTEAKSLGYTFAGRRGSKKVFE